VKIRQAWQPAGSRDDGPSVPQLVVTAEYRDGGSWRYIGSDDGGGKYCFRGVFHGTPSLDGIVRTVEFDGTPGRVCLETVTFTERGGTTHLHAITITAPGILHTQMVRSR
jgi:uncharacterized protein YndB with AHSA1/START domain